MQERIRELEKQIASKAQEELCDKETLLTEQLRVSEAEKQQLQQRILQLEQQETPSMKNVESGHDKIKDAVRMQVAAGLERRDPSYVRRIFDQFRSEGTDVIPKTMLPNAMRALHAHQTPDEAMEELMRSDDEATLDFDRFCYIVNYPSSLEKVLEKISFSKILADAVPQKDGMDALTVFKGLTSSEISAIVEGMVDGLQKVVFEHVLSLRESFLAIERLKDKVNPGASKFSVATMNAGTVGDFHEALQGRIGSPNLNFEPSMCMEHCSKSGFDFVFVTSNYKISTTPRDEWQIVVDRKLEKASMEHGRSIPDVNALLETRLARTAMLQRSEVIAVVLYTGPMFMVYNAILRQWPDNISSVFTENKYSTTIHVLVSAVQKIARSTKLPDNLKLYRGLGGTIELPEQFFKADEQGCRGFTEWGFMSTTSNRAIALQYSGARQGLAHASVMVLQVGAVDRGACIRDFSQYQQEIEYLWLPCSFVAPLGEAWVEMTEDGVVRMIPIHVNANLKAATIEQMVERRKQMHMGNFRYLIDEIWSELSEAAHGPAAAARWQRDPRKAANDTKKMTVEALVVRVLEYLKSALARQEQADAAQFADNDKYREFNQVMLESLRFARSKFEYWMQCEAEHIDSVDGYDPRLAHRLLIAHMTRQLSGLDGEPRRLLALHLARIRGLLVADVSEVNELGEDKLLQAVADGAGARDLQLLVWAGGDVNHPTPTGLTPLYTAAQGGHAESARALVALGAGVNAALRNGVGPLWIAALNGHTECVRVLAELRADLNMPKDNQCTPIYVAAEYGHSDCVALLAQLGAVVNRAEKVGMTPAFIAALNGHAETLRALMAAGADLDLAKNNGCTPLYVAAEFGHAQCVRALLELGADRLRANKSGKTPEWIARQNGKADCVALLTA